MKKLIGIISFFFAFSITFANAPLDSSLVTKSDSSSVAALVYTVKLLPEALTHVDSTLVNTILLDPEEDLFTPSFFAINSGLYKFPILLDTDDNGWVSKNFMMNYNSLRFKNDTTPLLKAKYDHGFDITHWFTAEFDRMIGKSKLSTKFNRNASETLYANTQSSRSNFMIGAELPFQKNYTATIGYFRNQANVGENGGIYNIEDIPNVDVFDATSLSSNLNTAQNNVFTHKALFNQSLLISSWGDSLRPTKLIFNLGTSLSENRYSFEMEKRDIDSVFFSNTFLDSTSTFDSIGFKQIAFNPTLKINTPSSSTGLTVHQEYHDNSILDNSYVGFNTSFNAKGYNFFKFYGQYHYQNSWEGNYKIGGEWNLDIAKTTGPTSITQNLMRFKTITEYSSSLPAYLFLNYLGNHYQWQNDFKAVNKLKINSSLLLNKRNGRIEFEIQNIDNYIYFNEQGLPNQTSDNITAGKLHLKNQFGKSWIKLYNGIGLQFSNSDLIRMPNFFSRNTLTFDFKLRGVDISAGTVFNFFSKYKGLAYNPATRHYNLSSQEVGGTPVVDWFLAARVGPADLYVKYDNSFYLLNRDLFIGENYPIYKSFLRFGLKWKLKN